MSSASSTTTSDPIDTSVKVDQHLEKLEEDVQNLLLQDPVEKPKKRTSRAKSIRKGLGKLISRSSSSKQDVSIASDTIDLTVASTAGDSMPALLASSSDGSPTDLAFELTRKSSDMSSSRQSSNDDIANSQKSGEEEDISPPNKYQGEATLEVATFDIEAYVLASKSDLELQSSQIDSACSVESQNEDDTQVEEESAATAADASSEVVSESQSEISGLTQKESEPMEQHDVTQPGVADEKSEKVLGSLFSSWIDKSKKKKRSRRTFRGRKSSGSEDSSKDESVDPVESVEACRQILSSVSFSQEKQLAVRRESLGTMQEKLLKAKIENIYNVFRTQREKRTQLKYAVFSWLLKNGTTLYAHGGGSKSSGDTSSTGEKGASDIKAITKTPKTEQDVLDAGLKVVQMRVEDLCKALNIRSKQQMTGFKKLLMARLKRLEQAGDLSGQNNQLMISSTSSNASQRSEDPALLASTPRSAAPISLNPTENSTLQQACSSTAHDAPMVNPEAVLITKTSSDDAEGFNVIYETCSNLCGTPTAIEAANTSAQDQNALPQEKEVTAEELDTSSAILQKFSSVDEDGDAELVDALVQLLSTSQDEGMGKEMQLNEVLSTYDQRGATNDVPQSKPESRTTATPELEVGKDTPSERAAEQSCNVEAFDFDLAAQMENIGAAPSNMLNSLFSIFCSNGPKELPAAIVSTPVTSFEASSEALAKGLNGDEANESICSPASAKMMSVVPFQKSPSDFLQARNQSRLNLEVRRSSSAPSQGSSGSLSPLSNSDEEEEILIVNQEEPDPAVPESKEIEVSTTREKSPSLGIEAEIQPLEEPVTMTDKASIDEPTKQESKRIKTKRKKRSKRKSSRNLLSRSFLAPITEHAEENASRQSEDSTKPNEDLDVTIKSGNTDINDEVALVVSYKMDDASFATFEDKSHASVGERNDSDELLQELTRSSSEDPKLFLSSEDTHSSCDAESVSERLSEDCDLDRPVDSDMSASTRSGEEEEGVPSNETELTEDRTLESAEDQTLASVDLSHTITQSTVSAYSARTNSLGSSHSSGSDKRDRSDSLGSSRSSGTDNRDRVNSLGSSQSSGTDNGISVWSPFGFHPETSFGSLSENFDSRTFESTIASTSEGNDESYDDDHSDQGDTVESRSSKGSLEDSLLEPEKYEDADTDLLDAPEELTIPVKKQEPLPLPTPKISNKSAEASSTASPQKRGKRGSLFKSKSIFGRKSQKEVDCTVEAEVGSVGHTVLEVYIPGEAEVSKQGGRLRIPSPKKLATILRNSTKKKPKRKSSFMPPPSPPSQQGRDDEEILRGQSTIDSREMETREMETRDPIMIPMPRSLTQF